MADAGSPAAGQTGIFARQDLAPPAGPWGRRGQELCLLPGSSEAQEDLEWLLREIQAGGGEALVCEARLLDGITDQEVRALFHRARDAEYEDLAGHVRELAKELGRKPSRERLAEAKAK